MPLVPPRVSAGVPQGPLRPKALTLVPLPARRLAGLGLAGVLLSAGAAQAQQADAAATLIEQGNYWQGLGRPEQAEDSWRKLLRVDAQSADALYGMGRVEIARGNAEAARTWLQRLRAAHPGDARVARLEAQLRQPAGTGGDLQRARAAAQAGRTAEALQLYRDLIGNAPPPEPLALEYYQLLGGTQQDWEAGRKGLEQLVQRQPDNAAYRLALAQVQTYREPSRREGIKALAQLAGQAGAAGTSARASWRQALIWLNAREADVPLYEAYLAQQPDDAVAERLARLRTGATARAEAAPAAAAAAAAKPAGEGFRALDRGNTAAAEQRFQEALRLQPGDAEALGGLGVIRLRQERFAEARQLLEQARRTGGAAWEQPLQSAIYWQRIGQARQAQQRGDLPGARGLYEQAVHANPREKAGLLGLAEVQAAAGDAAVAEQTYQRVLQIAADDEQALRGLVTLYTRTGREAEAQALGARLTPEQRARLGDLGGERVEQARAQARRQLQAGDTAAAQRTLEDAMLAVPDNPWVRLDLAQIYRRQGLVPQARSVMDGLLMTQPDMPDALFAGALLASDTGDAAAGLQYLERIPAASRTREMTQLQRRLWLQAQAQRAQQLARQGQAAAARQLLQGVQAGLGNDGSPELWSQLAEAYADAGDAPRALAMGRQLLMRSPNPSVGDRLRYASLLLKTRQEAELSALLRQLQAASLTPAQRTEFDGLRVGYAVRQADALRETGNLEAAYNAIGPVLGERPDDTAALGALARLYSAARDEKQALALYQRILQRQPTDLDVLLGAAASASAVREHDAAEQYVQAALRQAPEDPRVLAGAGRVYRNAGDGNRAEQYLRAAVAAEQRLAGGVPAAAGGAGGGGAPSANPFAGMTGSRTPAPPGLAGPAMLPAAYIPAPLAQAPAAPFAGSAAAVPAFGLPPLPAANTPGAVAGAQPWAAPGAQDGRATSAGRQRAGSKARQGAGTPAAAAGPGAYAAAPAAAYPAYAPPAYPPPASASALPQSLPPVQVAATSEPPAAPAWTAPPAPVSQAQAELDSLSAERSPTLSAGTVVRSRAGEAGLSRLTDVQVPVQARFSAGEGKLVVGVTPTTLDAGGAAGDFGTASRFGGGPAAALGWLSGALAPLEPQSASGVGLSVGYEGRNLSASLGTTPLGFPVSNVIGNVTYSGKFSDSLSFKADLSRRPVTDSLLSFAGAKDARTGQRWGGVVATGGRFDLGYDNGSLGVYGYGAYHALTGKEVERNNRVEAGGGVYMHLLQDSRSSLTAGMNVTLLHYDKNLSYYTYGHGGYFSPQRYFSVSFPIDWQGRADRWSWRVNASLGVQSFRQDAADYFPTDAARQGAVASQLGAAAALGLSVPDLSGRYAASSVTGVAYNLAGVLEYQVAPQLYLSGYVSLNNARNYRQFTGGIGLRYLLDGPQRFGSSPSQRGPEPLVSPYTPL